jgi:ferredoxin
VLYRRPKQDWLAPLIEEGRGANLKLAPADLSGVRRLLKALRGGEAVGMLPDQVPGQGEGAWLPFFGRPAYTMTLAARLAETGATVLMAYAERLHYGAGYHLKLFPLSAALEGDLAARAAQLNRELEALVRLCPEQYLWGYNRYKVPAGAERRRPESSYENGAHMAHVDFELAPKFANTPLGIEAEELLDKCIDCGQCMVKCPTFRLLNEDEESPRGRIQLMRKMYATGVVDHELQQRLDHCLTCRSCEAMCPEHVPFGHLLDITKSHIEKELPRTWRMRALRLGMRLVVPFRRRFGLALFLGRLFRKPVAYPARQGGTADRRRRGPGPTSRASAACWCGPGCAQPALGPSINPPPRACSTASASAWRPATKAAAAP